MTKVYKRSAYQPLYNSIDMAIGRKQSAKNSDFVRAWERIETLVSRDEAESLVASTVSEVRRITGGKRVGYAWSGGKDSIALQYVCERAGIYRCVIGISRPLELRMFMDWVDRFKPKGLQVYDANVGLQWLVEHPVMLFPESSDILAKWYKLIHHEAQRWFVKKNNLDIVCLGRRVLDGNYVGRGSNIYTDRNGVTRYSPLADWSHEQVLAVIHYFMNREIPPVYNLPEGWIKSTGAWPMQCSGTDEGWRYYWAIDKTIVETAAVWFESAKQFINSMK